VVTDIDGDQQPELILSGNFAPNRVQIGPSDASVGSVLKQAAPFQFVPVTPEQSGFWATGDSRGSTLLDNMRILVTVNDGEPVIFKSAP